jgi:hypothetical protein
MAEKESIKPIESKPVPTPPAIEPEPEIYIPLRTIYLQVGPQLVTYEPGEPIDDPTAIREIFAAFGDQKPPMRKVSIEALMAAGKI